MSNLANDIDWDGIKENFKAGWDAWVVFNDCTSKDSMEFRDGYEAAALANESGGARPTCEDGKEAAAAYLRAKQDTWYSDYCTYAD